MTINQIEREPDEVVRKFDRDDEERKERKGFSLIELMVVIAIIAILAAIAFLSVIHYQMVLRVNTSARDLAGHLRIARASAIRDGKPWSFVFFKAGGRDGFMYGLDSDRDISTWDRNPRTYYFEYGIIYGFCPNTNIVPGHPDPTVWSCPAMSVIRPVTDPVCLSSVANSFVYFERMGSVYGKGSGRNGLSDGVAYLIPSMDSSGTGQRDDRQRAVDWIGNTGRVRLWKYVPSRHAWQ